MTNNASMSGRALPPRRYLALWLPFLSTDRLKQARSKHSCAAQDDLPFAVVDKVRGAVRLCALNSGAVRHGLTKGLTLADARARLPQLQVAEADPAADAAALQHLAELCDRFTPMVALDPPEGLLLDVTGCAHLFGGEAHLRARIIAHVARLGLQVRATLAGTPDSARALARFSRVDIVPPGEELRFTPRLPVSAISGLEADTVVALSRAGLKTLGDLASRPPQALAARFGAALITGLQRTLGRENARITPLRPRPAICLEQQFSEPFTQTAVLEGVLEHLLDEAALTLRERGAGGRVFEASLFRSDGKVRRLSVETGRPCRDPQAVMRLLRERLASLEDPLDPGFGFDAVRLGIPLAEPLGEDQPGFDAHSHEREQNDVADLIDRLTTRLGRGRVLRFERIGTHDPQREARLIPAAGALPSAVQCWPQPEAGEPPLRPLQVFDPPQPIEAMAEVPDGPPIRFRWRRLVHEIAHAEGPERIASEWWRSSTSRPSRDYYRLEDRAGHRFWVFREGLYGEGGTPVWFLHGVFA